MIRNIARIGNFTSSEIVAITAEGKAKGTLGEAAWTYIHECNMERNLGRSIETEINARAITWGQLVEKVVFDILPTQYQLVSKETMFHPEHDFWAGSPDAVKLDEGQTVGDIKSPLTLKSFCQLVYPIYNGFSGIEAMNIIRFGHVGKDGTVLAKKHKDGEKFYWQLVSNAIITESQYAELIVYAPYKDELEAIKETAHNLDSEKQYRYNWINNAQEDELPFLIRGGYYQNLNIIRFEVPEADKIRLTSKALLCSKYLTEPRKAA